MSTLPRQSSQYPVHPPTKVLLPTPNLRYTPHRLILFTTARDYEVMILDNPLRLSMRRGYGWGTRLHDFRTFATFSKDTTPLLSGPLSIATARHFTSLPSTPKSSDGLPTSSSGLMIRS